MQTGPARVALLGSFTTKQLASFIDLYLFAAGIEADIYEAEYGIFRQEILDPASGFTHDPKVVFLATSWRDLMHVPAPAASQEEVDKHIAAEMAEWSELWHTAYNRLGCQIIQNNLRHRLGALLPTTNCGSLGV